MDQDIRIAFITPEAPPFSAGGIATFINNITKGLQHHGVCCEVFAPAIDDQEQITDLHGVVCHRIKTQNLTTFREDVVPYFLSRHKEKRFTIVESCEIHASLLGLMDQDLPDVKFVIRVQMPVVYQQWLNHYYESKLKKLRYVAGALRRGRPDFGFWNRVDVKRFTDPEYFVCEKADAIIATSASFKNWLVNFWRLPDEKIRVIHHLFDFTTMTPATGTRIVADDKIEVLFVGKLNAHKGVVNLVKAARKVWKQYPQVWFNLIGESWPIHYKGKKYETRDLLVKLAGHDERLLLPGIIPYDKLSAYYNNADICIFPSLWEAWGYTCSEAMSYGKAVIGSRNGGMKDAITHGKDGLLVDPHNVEDIADSLMLLVKDANLRTRLGESAKQTIETKLGFDKLTNDNIEFYKMLTSN